MGSRFSARASLLALLVLVSVCRAGELEPYHHELLNFRPSKIGSLPPFTASGLGFSDPFTKPTESSLSVRFANRIFRVKSSYLDRTLISNPFLGTKRKRSIFSLSGSSEFLGSLLKGESEFGFNSLDHGTAKNLGRAWAKMFRFGLKGGWHGYKYGGEYRSLDKGFMHFKGGESGRSEDSLRVWAEKGFGPFHLKATLSQLWEDLNESEQMPRVSRSSALSLKYTKGAWQTRVSSAYNQRTDRFQGGTAADAFSQEFRTEYKPLKAFKLIPLLRFASERDRNSGVRSTTPSASFTVTYVSWRNILKLAGQVSYKWARTSDRQTHRRDLNSSVKMTWSFDHRVPERKKLIWELSYSNHRDLIARVNSKESFSTKLTLTIHQF